mmetsp:Transcript_43437/g.97836  ORF Transcript_43437/g.97836 Transcript_43437/m.97836 type:complete len:248 (-) Transcript_43437:408-1151(-)
MCCQTASGRRIHRKGRTTIESIPPKPQHECTQADKGHVVGGKVSLICCEPARSRPKDDCTHQGANATCHVHNATSGEVIVANVSDGIFTTIEPASTAPSPIDHNGVDEGGHAEGEDDVRRKVDALCNPSTHNGRGSTTEGPLEEPADDVIGWAFVSSLNTIKDEILSEVLLVACKLGGWLSICSIRHHPAKRPPTERSQTDIEEIFQHQVLCVLSSASSAFQHCKPCLHQHHQRAADQQPQVVHSPS